MQPERVVEIRQGRSSLGTGYIIAPRHVLTARHVFEPKSKGSRCQIWPLGAVGDDARPLSERLRPAKRKARLDWSSSTKDFAVLAIEGEGFTGIPNSTVPFGCADDDGKPYLYLSAGLPEASGDQERRIEGSMNWARPELRFDINIGNGVPQDVAAWAGFSGAAVFSGGLLVAVIRTVDEKWGGEVLEATPVEFLLEDRDFERYCNVAGLTRPTKLSVARYNVPLLDSVSAQLHLINRNDQAEQIRTLITATDDNRPTEPKICVISGVDEDEHRHLIRRLASEPAIMRRLGKNALPERVIPELFWPSEWSIDPAVQLRDKLAAGLLQIIGSSNAVGAATTDPVEWRKLFELDTATRGFWIMLRRAQAGPGHAALLQSWLKLWSQLGKGRLVVLFLCIAWDDPPPPLPSPIPSFLRRAPALPDPELAGVVEATITDGWTAPVEPLTEIMPRHVGPWLDQIRPLCRHAAPEQLDGLRSLLLHFIENGKRLRTIDRQLGALRLQFETVAQGGVS
jgi:hypothetical protein